MKTTKLLFICSANYVRSPTAEHIARLQGYLARSAGTDALCNPITPEHLSWADVVICMENNHVEYVKKLSGHNYIVSWHLPDYWGQYMAPELVTIIERRLKEANYP